MKNPVLNQSGVITLDFIFGLILVFSFSAILFALSFTLSVVEIVQYITYASARNYYAAHVSVDKQKEMGQAKYQALTQNPVFKPLFANGWFTISPEVELGPSQTYTDDPNEDSDTFDGARTAFSAPVLKFSVPIFGSTSKDDTTFSTHVATWLMREPSFEECVKFNQERWQMIQQLQSPYAKAAAGGAGYSVITDNGC